MLKEFNLKQNLKKRNNIKYCDNLDNKREIVVFPKYKKILNRNKKLNRERERETEKTNLKSSNIASSLSWDNSKKELIDTIKNFLTETSDEVYSDINTCPSPEQVHRNNKSNMLKRTICKINKSKKSKINNKKINNINNFELDDQGTNREGIP